MNSLINKIVGILFIVFLIASGYWFFYPKQIIMDVNAVSTQAPQEKQARLVWGLWNLDAFAVASALKDGAMPYTVSESIKGLKVLPKGKILSPYAIALEGYLKAVYMDSNDAKIRASLDKEYAVLEFLIKNKVSVDIGVTTLDGNPSMRAFIAQSIERLNNERNNPAAAPDAERDYALATLERLQKLIDEYQPQ